MEFESVVSIGSYPAGEGGADSTLKSNNPTLKGGEKSFGAPPRFDFVIYSSDSIGKSTQSVSDAGAQCLAGYPCLDEVIEIKRAALDALGDLATTNHEQTLGILEPYMNPRGRLLIEIPNPYFHRPTHQSVADAKLNPVYILI